MSFKLNTEQGTTENITVAAFLNQELDCRNDFLSRLNLVKKDQSFVRDHRFIRNRRQAKQQILTSRCVFKEICGLLIFKEIDLNYVFVMRFSKVTDNKGFSNLSSACDKKVFCRCLYKNALILFRFFLKS